MNIILSTIVSISLSVASIYFLIPFLKGRNFGQPIREEGNIEHYKKAGTPTMGGFAFTLVFILVNLISVKFNKNILFVLLTTFLYGFIGFIDDYEKISNGRNLGLNASQKLILQFLIAFILTTIQYFVLDINIGELDIPFFKNTLNIGIFAIPLIMFIMVGTVNAANLSDGLDGLLSSVSIPIFIAIAVMSIEFNPEITQSALIFVGVLIGFLVFNSNPASIFMGDTGSMAIGGAVVSMVIILNKPIYLIFLAGVYLVEALSVIIQVISYKKTGKRVFLMSPIHHHFELKGHKETKIVAAFQVISVMLALLTIYLA
ncbi:MAG: phospho-N-acetylmuramoyl-pentapeptide-transferase [Helcococcus sp.]|nr:phospho-N-acetylmuramoyl-pentapeptide-transferase [Helcococcus sp.]